jgi:hypothetical protein
MFSKMNKTWFIIGSVLLILIILNPTYLNFKEFTGLTGKNASELHKNANYLICSIYQDNYNHKKYLAVVKNFIDITPSEPIPKEQSLDSVAVLPYTTPSTITDTTKVVTHTETFIKKPIDSVTEWDWEYIGGIPDTIHVSEDPNARKSLVYLRKCYRLYLDENGDLHHPATFPGFVYELKFPKLRRKMYNYLVIEYDLGSYKQFEKRIDPYYKIP